jgi:hypothetical protein
MQTTQKRNKNKNNKKILPIRPVAVPRISGQGGYLTDAFRSVGKMAKEFVPKGTFSKLGESGGAMLGGPLGGRLGSLFGKGIASIAGFGDYTVCENSLMARVDEGVQIPEFTNSSHATLVRHREYIGDISATGSAFFNQSFPINPGLSTTFPWLASVASSFDAYQVLGMVFEFKTLSSDITAGGALGSVILATDYDVVDPAYNSKLYMENSEYCVSVKPSISCIHAIECDPKVTFSPIKYIRSGGVPTGKDPRLYDMGNFQVATQGLPTSSGVIGELWVSYEIALYKPNLEATITGGVDHFQLSTSVSTSHYLTATTTTVAVPTGTSTIGGTITNSTYSFPPLLSSGTFSLSYYVQGTSTSLTAGMSDVCTNCAVQNYFFNNTQGYVNLPGTQVDTIARLVVIVKVTGPNATVAFTAGSLPAAITGGDLLVQALVSTS